MKNLHKNEKTVNGKKAKIKWNSAATKNEKTKIFFLPILSLSARHRFIIRTGISAKTVTK